MAYTGETPFQFLRRVRLATALRMMQDDPQGRVTEIAMDVGYETPSAFNKVFKNSLGMTPSEFRNLGKVEQSEISYRLNQTYLTEETKMNLTQKPEVVTYPVRHLYFVGKEGPFAEIAPIVWNELFPLLKTHFTIEQMTSYLGLSMIDVSKQNQEKLIYEAGVTVESELPKVPKGMQYKKITSGHYARFILTGSYSHVWPAFREIFRTLAKSQIELRQEFCIENYLNDPNTTPEDQLLTELLVPIA